MMFIVAHHYVVNSGLTDLMYTDPLSSDSIFLFLFGAWGKTGINCFVMITGYFMCKSQISLKKFLKLFLEIVFYNIVIYLFFLLTGYSQFNIKDLIKTLFPVYSISTGFTSCYLVFYLFIPFLNILIRNMNEKQHLRLLLLLFFMYMIIGTIPKFTVTMNYVSWFIVLFFIASYIRIYDKPVFHNTKFWLISTTVIFILSIFSVLLCLYLGKKHDMKLAYYFVADSNKILAVLCGVSSFMFFKNIKIKYNRLINSVSACTFGVLLIHANSDTMRQWLWRDTLNNVGMFGSEYLVSHALLSVIFIFVICNAIDQIRLRIIEKPLFVLYDKNFSNIYSKLLNFENKILRKLNIGE